MNKSLRSTNDSERGLVYTHDCYPIKIKDVKTHLNKFATKGTFSTEAQHQQYNVMGQLVVRRINRQNHPLASPPAPDSTT